MKGGPYATIDGQIAKRIQEVHRKYPNLGHEGLTTVLEQEGIHVDEAEFKRFVLAHDLDPGETGRPTMAHVARRVWWPVWQPAIRIGGIVWPNRRQRRR
jgi:hypothetical protein